MKKPYDRYPERGRRNTPTRLRATVPAPPIPQEVTPSKKITLKPCPICEKSLVTADQVEEYNRTVRSEIPTDPPPDSEPPKRAA